MSSVDHEVQDELPTVALNDLKVSSCDTQSTHVTTKSGGSIYTPTGTAFGSDECVIMIVKMYTVFSQYLAFPRIRHQSYIWMFGDASQITLCFHPSDPNPLHRKHQRHAKMVFEGTPQKTVPARNEANLHSLAVNIVTITFFISTQDFLPLSRLLPKAIVEKIQA